MTRPLFTGQGHFSHINPSLMAELESHVGRMTWFDARQATTGPVSVIRGVTAALARRPTLLSSPRALYHARIGTTPMFDAMSAAVRGHADGANSTFVFQTQGLFNGHVPGRPFFVYTDYTHLANRTVNPKFETNSSRWLARERSIYREADRIFAASSFTRDSLVADYGIPPDNVTLAQTGLNVPIPEAIPERDPTVCDVVFVGVDWKRKGGPELLRAFEQLRSRVPNATLTIIGCRPAARGPGVRVLGRLPPEEMAEHMAKASVFCLPSHHEPAGIAYSEASAWGLPVVSTTVGNIADRVLDGVTGILVEPGDVTGLAGALQQLAESPDVRSEYGAAGRAYTLEHFTWKRVAMVVADAIADVLASYK